jgi:hypothetical protein
MIAVCAFCGCTALKEPLPPEESKVEFPPVTLPVVKPEPVADPDTKVVQTLLAEYGRLRRLTAPDLAREQEAARQAFAQSRSDAARIQLAMTLTVPGGAANEEARALELLEPIVKNPTAPLHGLAFLLTAQIQEQRRLIAQVQGLQQNNQGLQQNVQALQQNVQGLQQKLDALRTLERSMSERTEPAPRKR